MLSIRRIVFALFIGILLSSGLFAQNSGTMDQYFDADSLNKQIDGFVRSIYNFIPDSTTLQNMWSYVPGGDVWVGVGLGGSFTFKSQKDTGSISRGMDTFGADNLDLTKFPQAIPYLPGVGIDARIGMNRFDVGMVGMWLDENILAEYVGTNFLGEGSYFGYRTLGIDARYALLMAKGLIPNVTLQAGYYFTWLNFGFTAKTNVGRELVDIKFANDTFMFGAQATYSNMPLIIPFAGLKMISSRTHSGYEWQTQRPVMIKDEPYLNGVNYVSGANEGDYLLYFQVYGGFGLSLVLEHELTFGMSYNLVTNHFCINLAARMIIGN